MFTVIRKLGYELLNGLPMTLLELEGNFCGSSNHSVD